ncbi:DUF6875 domain-containing protein [Endozoicomonas numazuensis]|uniref:DUF6875 domain-containing protein n=1 Tax=Endozoicomonas numazuensis TaxID=1137799 RepID=UPI00068CA8E3|nr:hypothetical protein [Endozoicomonas numazuensis]
MIWTLSQKPAHLGAKSVYPAIREYIREFLVLDHPFRKGKMFPFDFDLKKLLQLQRKGKVKYVKRQLMIGATYSINQSPSIHCPDYYPLRTETPCLIVRALTVDDLVFLNPEHYSIFKRITFLKTFIEMFKDSKPKNIKKQVNSAKNLIQSYKKQLLIKSIFLSIFLALTLTLMFFLTRL